MIHGYFQSLNTVISLSLSLSLYIYIYIYIYIYTHTERERERERDYGVCTFEIAKDHQILKTPSSQCVFSHKCIGVGKRLVISM